jgi:hypothetical protein
MLDNPELNEAYRGMADLTWKTMDSDDLTAMTLMYKRHKQLHEAERESKRDARWKMLLWRRKQSYKDQQANEMVTRWFKSKPGAKRLIVFYGNAGFAATGRREKAVPTKEWVLRLLHAMKRNNIPGGILMTSEYLTSQMCHKCFDLTKPKRDAAGAEMRDLRCCTGTCALGSPNNCRDLNRDKNAAINIYKAGWAFVKGKDRPAYLTKDWKDQILLHQEDEDAPVLPTLM